MNYKHNLYDKLIQHDMSGMYPFHMPGHKRNTDKAPLIDPYRIDITEIDGFDDLNYAQECLLDAEDRASHIFGSEKTYFLINGCTGGLLAAISACCRSGDGILIARNCHKAVYNAVHINRLKPVYVWPDQYNDCNGGTILPEMMCGPVSAVGVRKVLEKNAGIRCVVITSPTYEGVISDIQEIANVVHNYNIPLIVDEAHGAHMKFSDMFPESAVERGADIVIHGIHKTLPSFTQTALLHLTGKYINVYNLERNLSIFQTSSPSYILMGSIDYCMEYLNNEAVKDYAEYKDRLTALYLRLYGLSRLYVLPYSNSRDASKLVICTDRSSIDGAELYKMLRKQFRLQPEMAARQYVIMMTSVWDTAEAYYRLAEALEQIDSSLESEDKKSTVQGGSSSGILYCSEYVISPALADERAGERIDIDCSWGRVSQEMFYVYPPGIPLVVPGERITNEHIKLIEDYRSKGFEIKGLSDKSGSTVLVVAEDLAGYSK